jgi:hypothetical protein
MHEFVESHFRLRKASFYAARQLTVVVRPIQIVEIKI